MLNFFFFSQNSNDAWIFAVRTLFLAIDYDNDDNIGTNNTMMKVLVCLLWHRFNSLGHSFCFPLIYLESLYLNLYATFALKYQRGRRARKDQWVFGVISTEHIPCRGNFQVVRSRSRAILTQIMQRVLLPESEVHTDGWASYRNLPRHVANVRVHRTVVHQNHFVDPLTGIHIQEAESAWSRLKYHVEREKGIRRADLQEFLNEQMWRDWRGLDAVFCNLIVIIT